jgi:hypothetical protein
VPDTNIPPETTIVSPRDESFVNLGAAGYLNIRLAVCDAKGDGQTILSIPNARRLIAVLTNLVEAVEAAAGGG